MNLINRVKRALHLPHEDSLCLECPEPDEFYGKELPSLARVVPIDGLHVDHANEVIPEKGVGALYKVEATVHKYLGDFTAEEIAEGLAEPYLYEVTSDIGNLLVTSGATRLLERLIGTSSKQAMDNTHTFVGVGDTNTAAVIGNTDLAAATGSTHRQWKGLDATYPTQSSNSITLKATYGSTEGNFAWVEWGIEVDDGTSSPGTAALSTSTQKLFNRKAPVALGTKGAGTTWTLTITITAT